VLPGNNIILKKIKDVGAENQFVLLSDVYQMPL